MEHGQLKEHSSVWNIFCRKYLIAITEIYLGEEKSHFVRYVTVSLHNYIPSLWHLNRPWSSENENEFLLSVVNDSVTEKPLEISKKE